MNFILLNFKILVFIMVITCCVS